MKIAGIFSKHWIVDLQSKFDRAVEFGCQGIELCYSHTTHLDMGNFRDSLTRHSLRLAALRLPISFADKGLGMQTALKAAELVQRIDHSAYLILSDINTSFVSIGKESCLAYGKFLAQIADSAFREAGVHALFCHHCDGFLRTVGELDCLLSLISPAKTGLCFDTGQYAHWGNAVDGIDKYGKRVRYVRFTHCQPKSIDITGDKLSQRTLGFAAIAQALENGGYRGWIAVDMSLSAN